MKNICTCIILLRVNKDYLSHLFPDRRLSRRKNQRRSLETLKKSFGSDSSPTMEHKSNGSDILGSYRPPPVTAGCTKEIPETIHEESESRRQSIDATKRKTSVQRRFETLADIVQSSEDSANSNTLSSLNDDGNSSNTQNMNVSYSDIEMSEMNLLGADSGVYEQDKRGFKNAASSSFTSMSDGLTNGGDNMSLPSTDSMTSVNNVGNSSKVQPLKGDSFESAVGFLLESSLKKNPQGGKRVKFNYV